VSLVLSVLYTDEKTKDIAKASLKKAQKEYPNNPIVTIIEPLKSYYKAEEYHQDYYQQNQMQGYCMAVIPPKIAKLKEKFSKEVM